MKTLKKLLTAIILVLLLTTCCTQQRVKVSRTIPDDAVEAKVTATIPRDAVDAYDSIQRLFYDKAQRERMEKHRQFDFKECLQITYMPEVRGDDLYVELHMSYNKSILRKYPKVNFFFANKQGEIIITKQVTVKQECSFTIPIKEVVLVDYRIDDWYFIH